MINEGISEGYSIAFRGIRRRQSLGLSGLTAAAATSIFLKRNENIVAEFYSNKPRRRRLRSTSKRSSAYTETENVTSMPPKCKGI
jgi:hypothetical protein